MTKLQTHYDNLKVARSAPAEVIRAAYKTLSQKYHPDRNNADVESARIMAIINASYEVLSDSAKRQQHDAWITQQESMASVATPRHTLTFKDVLNISQQFIARADRLLTRTG